MAREEFEKLGFSTEEEYERIRSQAPVKEGTKEGARAALPPLALSSGLTSVSRVGQWITPRCCLRLFASVSLESVSYLVPAVASGE